MKTTEVFIEQVIIGSIVLLLGFFLHQDNIAALVSQFPYINYTEAKVVFGFVLIAVAYLIGMVYDRYADSVFQDFERLSRIRFALNKQYEKQKILTDKELFPEHKYRMKLYKQSQAISAEEYLRTRLRLLRALTTLTPVITTVLIFRLGSIQDSYNLFLESALYPTGIVLVYILILLRKVIQIMERKPPPPKTDEKEKLIDFLDSTNLYTLNIIEGKEKYKLNVPYLWRMILFDWTTLFSVIMVISFASAELIIDWRLGIFLITLFGIMVTSIIFWAWWRIHRTYFKFLSNFWDFYD